MKKGSSLFYAFAVALFLVLLSNSAVATEVTGKATQASITFSVEITGGPPAMGITKPVNGTYIVDNSLPIELILLGVDYWWYNLDGGQNFTFLGNVTSSSFNASAGSHTIYLFANNSIGADSQSKSFSVNTTKLEVIFDEFNATNRGASTNFYHLTFEEMQNISNLTFENTAYGKVVFSVNINVTNDVDPSDRRVDFSSNVNISFNRVSIDSGSLPNLNTRAVIAFYGLSFSDPRILRDGEVCPASICRIINYTGGNLTFNVTHFSTYSAEETPSNVTPTTGGDVSGGGGGDRLINITPIKEEEEREQEEELAPVLCAENWSCTEWSECEGFRQKRICEDLNKCETEKEKPWEARVCVTEESAKSLLNLLAVVVVILVLIIGYMLVRSKVIMNKSYKEVLALIERGHDYADKGDLKQASAEYADLKRRMERSGHGLSKTEIKRIHQRALKLYNRIISMRKS